MNDRKVLITGVCGQDGSYLAELLCSEGYQAWGLSRPSARPLPHYLEPLLRAPGFKMLVGDLQDSESLMNAVATVRPQYIYNLGAVSYAPASWAVPGLTMKTNAVGVVNLLEVARKIVPEARFYQASTSEMFGAVTEVPQNEKTPFRPVHPYGSAKLAAHWTAVNYREQFGMGVSCGILFNHESPRRGMQFVTHKVTRHAVLNSLGYKEKLSLWTLDTERDWGFAGDYVKAMKLMLENDRPDDYVVGTGASHTVKDLVVAAYDEVGLNWEDWIVVEPPSWFKVDTRCSFRADTSKIRSALGWNHEIGFRELVRMMVKFDYDTLKKESR